MIRLIDAMRRAREDGTLPERFRSAAVREACPGWDINTYRLALTRHCRGHSGGFSVYFIRHDDGSYSFID